jgi:hypothetical protein
VSDQIILTLPEDLSRRARQIAATAARPVEQLLIEYISTLQPSLPPLPPDIQAELDALSHLSDDALWAIARAQMPAESQARAQTLLRARIPLSEAESAELDQLVERADRLMLRKAEAASILRARGHAFQQSDFAPRDG